MTFMQPAVLAHRIYLLTNHRRASSVGDILLRSRAAERWPAPSFAHRPRAAGGRLCGAAACIEKLERGILRRQQHHLIRGRMYTRNRPYSACVSAVASLHVVLIVGRGGRKS